MLSLVSLTTRDLCEKESAAMARSKREALWQRVVNEPSLEPPNIAQTSADHRRVGPKVRLGGLLVSKCPRI